MWWKGSCLYFVPGSCLLLLLTLPHYACVGLFLALCLGNRMEVQVASVPYTCEKQVSPRAVSCEDCDFCSATGSLEHSTSPWFGSQLYIQLPRQQRGIAVAVSPEQRPWSYRYNDKSRLPSQYLHWQQLMCNTEIHSPAITGKKKVNKIHPFPLKLSLTLLPFLRSWTRIALLFLQSDPPGTVLSVRRLCWTESLYFSLVINLKTFT